jgi:hypothetical protein
MATWLEQANYIRAMAHLDAVTEDPTLSQADQNLAQYEVENLRTISHLDGEKNNPNFTAAQNSNIWGSFWAGIPINEADIVNQWGLSVFHGLIMLDPHLKKVGFGSYSAPPANALTAISWSGGLVTATTTTAHGVQVGQWVEISGVTPSGYNAAYQAASGTTGSTLVCALAANPGTATGLGTLSRPLKAVAALNVQQGLDPTSDPHYPVTFPGNYVTTMAATYPLNEQPDARKCCSYSGIAGLPISIQLGPGVVQPSASASLWWSASPNPSDQTPVEFCLIHEHNYTNPDDPNGTGQKILANRGAIVILPRAPLVNGHYFVNFSAGELAPTNGWPFSVARTMTIPANPAG